MGGHGRRSSTGTTRSTGSRCGLTDGRARSCSRSGGWRGAASRSSACTGTRTWSRWCGASGSSRTSSGSTGGPGPPAAARPQHMVRHLDALAGAGGYRAAHGGDRGRGRRRGGRARMWARGPCSTPAARTAGASLEAAGVPVVDSLEEAVALAETVSACAEPGAAGRAAGRRGSASGPRSSSAGRAGCRRTGFSGCAAPSGTPASMPGGPARPGTETRVPSTTASASWKVAPAPACRVPARGRP